MTRHADTQMHRMIERSDERAAAAWDARIEAARAARKLNPPTVRKAPTPLAWRPCNDPNEFLHPLEAVVTWGPR